MTEWRDIPGYDGYQASDSGHVRSMKRGLARLLREQPKDSGHLTVGLCLNGKKKNKSVHQLVMLAFVGSRPDGLECCHNDGDPTNNRLENLRYDTHRNNQRDMLRHGTHPEARKTHCAQGHEFTAGNIYTRTGGAGRRCRTCVLIDSRKREKTRVRNRKAAA